MVCNIEGHRQTNQPFLEVGLFSLLEIWPEKELFCRNRTIEDIFIGLVHCTQYGASFHLQKSSISFHVVIFGSPEPYIGHHCLWCMPVTAEYYLGNEINIVVHLLNNLVYHLHRAGQCCTLACIQGRAQASQQHFSQWTYPKKCIESTPDFSL